MVSLDNIDNLRVKDLRSELQKRGLDKNGVKATLAARLKRALDAEIAAIADKDAEKLEEVHEDQSNILLEILEIVKSIDKRLKRLEAKKDVRDATTDTAFEEESDIVNNTIHHDSVEDHSDNHRQQEEIITVPTSNPFEVLAVQESSDASTTSTTTTTSAPSTSPPYQEQIEGYRQRHRLVSNKHDVVVVGDSMIKHIDGRRLSRHKKVKCVSFPGAKVRDIFTSSPCESLKPGGELIIHAGTNNISEGAAEVSHQITDLCKSVSAEGFSVSISTIIHRRWESAAERKRVDAINDLLESAASENRWGLVFNNTITEQHLGRDGVHLNRAGQRILASNLRRLINWDNSPTGSLPRPAGRQTQVRGGNQSLASSRSSPVRSYAEAVSGPGGSLDFSPVGQRSRLKLASRSSKVDMKDWEKYLHFVRRPDECESTAKLLKVTERHLQDTGLLLSQIKEHKTCTSQALVDVKDLVDSLNEILPLLKTTSPTPTATPESSKFQCPSLLDIRPPRDCSDIALAGSTTSGRYVVYPDEEFDPFYVFCDMENDGGGWTVFQRRLDGGTNFFRTWIEYRYGFGQLTGEHWLGNDKLHRLTSGRSYELRVDLEDFDGVKSYAVYDHFGVGDELDGYTMSLGEYNGTAGDSLSYHNGQPFTTRDHDNDGSGGNCAKLYSGAWWYQRCHFSNLNGKYYDGGKLSSKGASWYHWKNSYYSVKKSEMKIRPIE